jgi:hypothetical protein
VETGGISRAHHRLIAIVRNLAGAKPLKASGLDAILCNYLPWSVPCANTIRNLQLGRRMVSRFSTVLALQAGHGTLSFLFLHHMIFKCMH